jgi:dihydrofolate reductase
MSRVRVHSFSVSVDGFGAGPDQSFLEPLGVGGQRVHEWFFTTRTGREMVGEPGGTTGTDDAFVADRFAGAGATVMGRNMFGPVRGPWDGDWDGWWGDEPPYGHDVFVLTHFERAPLPMDGGTTFHFVTDGLEAALERARESAGDQDVVLGGGVSTLREALAKGLVDDLHLVVAPVVLGRGEQLFDGSFDLARYYECTEHVGTELVTHYRFRRRSS